MSKFLLKVLKFIKLASFLAFIVLFFLVSFEPAVRTNPTYFNMSERMQDRYWVIPALVLLMALLPVIDIVLTRPKGWKSWFQSIFKILFVSVIAFGFIVIVSFDMANYRNLLKDEKPLFLKGIVSNSTVVGQWNCEFKINYKKIYIEREIFPWSFHAGHGGCAIIEDGMKLEVTMYGEKVVRISEY